jgi:dipeptidyl aminopeptidase/acylaminoacyl peptidase
MCDQGKRRWFGTAAVCVSLFVCWAAGAFAAVPLDFQKPPKNVLDILNAPPLPLVSVNPAGDHVLIVQGVRYPPIADLAEPMLRLAGLRINPLNNSPHRVPRFVSMTLHSIDDGKKYKIAVPAHAHLGIPVWSPDGKQFAFTNTTARAVELWVGQAADGKVRRLEGVVLNAVLRTPVRWMPDSRSLLCNLVDAGRGKPPQPERVPRGPVVQESIGKKAPAPTFQDLLKSSHDEDLFDYYATAQLALVDCQTGRAMVLGKPAVFESASPSPDGRHFLVARLHRPYSYLLPARSFPKDVEVWDREGKVEYKLASLPLADQVPIGGVPKGPRTYAWRPTEPATLCWVEALDEGNPRKKVPHRDQVLLLKAPFESRPVELARARQRVQSLAWVEKGSVALLREYDRRKHRTQTFLLQADKPGEPARLIWDLSVSDAYKDPGIPVPRRQAAALGQGRGGRAGGGVLRRSGRYIFLIGRGASPEGDRPFLDRLDLTTLKTERLFHCPDKAYETVVALLAEDGSRFLTRHETVKDPPNYFVRTADGKTRQALTHITDPAPQLRAITKQLVTYKRPDGVQLSFTLYLPPGYKKGQRLPAVVWAYPREFTSRDTASQVSGSPHRFTTLDGISHLFFLTQGYAILDGAAMPVVGDPETVNNTYVEQIVASAKAAIDKADAMGVIDRKRVGVGGHSYGAFMTANLLAHSDLFRAGIARSGAYNRTLTPFGFQSERRTLWEAPEMYWKVSPFMHADKIKTPILLIHGKADNNSGTFPIQSERMYQAIKGNGGKVRFVSLPFESHGYEARESVEHTLYEMITWFDKYVKNAATDAGDK